MTRWLGHRDDNLVAEMRAVGVERGPGRFLWHRGV
jgi:hypothetical protein